MKGFNPELAENFLKIPKKFLRILPMVKSKNKINAAAELYLSTSGNEYENVLSNNQEIISKNIYPYSLVMGRVVKKLNNDEFTNKIKKSVVNFFSKVEKQQKRKSIWSSL